MLIYNFYDTDSSGMAEYNICNEDYKVLLEICFKYCKTMSLIITNNNSKLLKKIEKFQIEKSENIIYKFNHYDNNVLIKYYQTCSELLEVLLNTTDNIFSWINGWGYDNPEDITFYRDDGSVFFTSIIHNGKCSLFVRKNEDVSLIIKNKLWIQSQQSGQSGDGSVID
ncbi:MAG: hypothetical protein IJP34_03675 [Clostridia bacterium]|nr:hypothetical protein [Clostridia bacterium]